MSIAIIGSIVTNTVSTTAVSRPELAAGSPDQIASLPQAAAPPAPALQDATVTTLSDEALAQQAADDQAARDAAAAATIPTSTDLLTSDWATGVPTVDNPVVQEALTALDEASRKTLQVSADSLAAYQDQVAVEQKDAADAAAAAAAQNDAGVLAAINVGIRIAYGALPSPVTGDPVLREPGQVDVVA